MRNNQDRIGTTTPSDSVNSANVEAQQTNSLEFIVPTEIVELPSKGLFYDEGHPLYHVESIEIKHMTTKEEDILTNESYIRDSSVIETCGNPITILPFTIPANKNTTAVKKKK